MNIKIALFAINNRSSSKTNKMRKYDLDESKFKCCLCCHVRIGTIILGLFHMLMHILVLGCLISYSLNVEMQKEDVVDAQKSTEYIVVGKDTESTDTSAVLEIQYDSPNMNLSWKKLKRDNLWFAFALVMCTFLIAPLMVYGAVRNRPGYLMPFFCLQVFDFCITCLTIVGYITYAPNIKLWILQQNMNDCPLMNRLLEMDEKYLMLLFVIFFALVISMKAYLLDMVWSCYKYLQMKRANNSVVREYTLDPDSEMLLPPKYEEVLRMKGETVAPPPYTA